MKTDLRVRYTRDMIQKVYLELLQQKPAEKITVTEVCERAEINRGTFYKHYQDCYDLRRQIEEEALLHFDEALLALEHQNAQPIFLSILQTLKSNRKLFDSLAMHQESNQFVRKLAVRCFRHKVLSCGGTPSGQGENVPQRTISGAFLAGGCSSVMEYWLQSGMREPPEQIAAEMNALVAALHAGMSLRES